jgi:hypothetical protein
MRLFWLILAASLAGTLEAQEPVPATSDLVLVCSQEPSCGHFFADGKLYKTLSTGSIVVSVSLTDTGKYMRADVAVTNNGPTVDVLPATFVLNSVRPDAKELRYVPPEKMISSARRRAAWGNALAAAGSGMQTTQSTTQSSTNGNVNVYGSDGSSANGTYSGTTTSNTTSPDYATQARTRQQIAERRMALAAASNDLLANSLLATTLTTGQTKAGRVYFERNRHHAEALLIMKVGDDTFEFPFAFKK